MSTSVLDKTACTGLCCLVRHHLFFAICWKNTIDRCNIHTMNDPFMASSRLTERELLTAHTAGVPSFSCVGRQMLCEVRIVPEDPSTEAACVRLVVAQVQLPMSAQAERTAERLATNVALVGVHSHMDPLVLDELGFLLEALAA